MSQNDCGATSREPRPSSTIPPANQARDPGAHAPAPGQPWPVESQAEAPSDPSHFALNAGTTPAQRLAAASAIAMWSDDSASRGLGMRLESVEPGRATLSMTVRDDMTNGHGMCHGGFIFLLADSTFAFACNSHNARTVAAGAEIHFLAPAQRGDRLIAQAEEVHRGGRSGIYDIRVSDQNGKAVAVFRGRSATLRGFLVPPTDDDGSGTPGGADTQAPEG